MNERVKAAAGFLIISLAGLLTLILAGPSPFRGIVPLLEYAILCAGILIGVALALGVWPTSVIME